MIHWEPDTDLSETSEHVLHQTQLVEMAKQDGTVHTPQQMLYVRSIIVCPMHVCVSVCPSHFLSTRLQVRPLNGFLQLIA